MHVKEKKDMNNEEIIMKTRMGKKNPFRVPEGYFDNLTAQVMDRLPEDSGKKVVTMKPSLIVRLRPVLYVAACLFIAVLSFAVYLDKTGEGSEEQMMAEQVPSYESNFEDVADYVMVDNYEIYACLTND